jgi:hypothetical protein
MAFKIVPVAATAVFNIIDCICIAWKAVYMKYKYICNEQLSIGIRFVPLYRSQRIVIVRDNNSAKQWSVCQRYCSVSMELE